MIGPMLLSVSVTEYRTSEKACKDMSYGKQCRTVIWRFS